MFELMDRIPSIDLEGGKKLSTVNQVIQFHDVCFPHPSRPDTDVFKVMMSNAEYVARPWRALHTCYMAALHWRKTGTF
ncbi:uncharacterized protein [Acropora muricata]|uniref:uncharacterized protein n=1 Tax=Acropora muricata TaxID=159855 RepID=UPI0034E619B9